MAHFAKVRDGFVVDVIVAEPEFFQTFVDSSAGEWIQTSYNTRGGVHYDPNTGLPSADQSKALRKNYAGIGYVYDRQLDAFYEKQRWASWVLDPETCLWQPPILYPNDNKTYDWDETNQTWVNLYD
jgi:hypothetical protein